MNYHRVEEIVNSEKVVEVFYNQKPVWINNIDPDKRSAQVTYLDQNFEVPVNDLQEGNFLQ